MENGTVLRIERISKNDGQGLRTVVFLKGCPLHCAWCSTPESQAAQPELFYKQNKCLHCARCIKECPQHALSVSESRCAVIRDRSKCVNCFHCTEICPSKAMGLYGETMTVEQVMREIRTETMFYFFSNGGVTLSGGDILLQETFARAILKECKKECIHTMAEMDMFGSYDKIQRVMEYLDAYYVDIKLMDASAHRKWTGVSNETILENIRRTSSDYPNKALHARVPLVHGINDSIENICQTTAFCKQLPSCTELEFLPYHRLGTATYAYLDRPYALEKLPPMTPDEVWKTLACINTDDLPFRVTVSGA